MCGPEPRTHAHSMGTLSAPQSQVLGWKIEKKKGKGGRERRGEADFG